MTTNPRPSDYKQWTREQLIERLVALEGPRSVAAGSASHSPPPASTTAASISTTKNIVATKSPKEFNFANHPKRKIALKFCYSGWEYGGLAYQTGHVTQLPTVEGVLFDAMAKARLIDPNVGMEGCGWEKCGRTDKGVSAAGQVVSLWVRSAVGGASAQGEHEQEVEVVKTGEEQSASDVDEDSGLPGLGEEDFGTLDLSRPSSPKPSSKQAIMDSAATPKLKKELDYVAILNRLLPPTIRILAWAPVASTFSARFSCQYRHYKYFFSSHSLDISAMREAASKLIGEHDFRNLCKVDAQKQITRFRRIITRADIESVDSNSVMDHAERGEGMYVFNLVGSAFLYHQVRHIMAILFLIGTGLEKPSLVTKLMNVARGAEPAAGDDEDVVEAKPEYQMADALPLMLWDCGYAEEDVKWRSESFEPDTIVSSTDEDTRRSGQGTDTDLYHQLHSIWNRSRVYTLLDRHFLQAAERYHRPPQSILPLSSISTTATSATDFDVPVNYPLGGGAYKRAIKYVPMLKRNRLDTVEKINERWRLGKGLRRAERRGNNGNGGIDDGDE
ncbi:hypothetical protein D9756_011430 [Leucocoprinus leucothites]|uniref:Pseudouridine synthase I TruA alpha/beta domain-containing protein n=1 Tax=Leucocoprinus leucothites TaxID=201217 RepID=A0A8H5CMF8_9AGAR|nr:hypothetical protein D9756_011430 [Leucoagaricus leucothites]